MGIEKGGRPEQCFSSLFRDELVHTERPIHCLYVQVHICNVDGGGILLGDEDLE